MKIYVKSRGASQDYCWLDAKTNTELEDKPPELPKFKVDVDDFALILQRQGTQLALFVTGLISSKRVDYQNRKIRNSVLWVTDDESCLRRLTIQALGEEEEPLGEQLAAQLDEMIYSTTTEPGFEVDVPEMENLMENLAKQELDTSEPSALEGKIGNLSTLKADLQNELMQSSFPKGDGLFLVVVSPTLSQNSLDNHNIWRGLSNQIDPDEGWIEKKNTSLNRNRDDEPPNFQKLSQRLNNIIQSLENLETIKERDNSTEESLPGWVGWWLWFWR